ncbi:DUF1801 domain-containing protein [Microbacterium sp. ZW T5_56]|uniref:DUF1801 domain-containing protein n=1 Tax=Microbacterium sp. ZW T5_56 TaxID=3378081 RepID=UPI003853C063
MKPTGGDVAEFVAAVTPDKRRRDAETLVEVLSEITGLKPVLWGTIIGFGACHYRYPTGTEGDMPLAAFAPRKASSTIYLLEGAEPHAVELAVLGPHTVSRGCLYLKDLTTTDLSALRRIIKRSYALAVADEIPGMTITTA